MIREKRPPTAVAWNIVRPTRKQIETGLFVVPKPFIDGTIGKIIWHSFNVVFNGESQGNKHIDGDNRLRLKLIKDLKEGDVLRLSVESGTLHIERLGAAEVSTSASS